MTGQASTTPNTPSKRSELTAVYPDVCVECNAFGLTLTIADSNGVCFTCVEKFIEKARNSLRQTYEK